MTIHTGPGCSISQGVSQTGTTLRTDCGPSSDNAGCSVLEANTKSYGKPFADSGGGVWVTQFDTSGIRIWFVPVSESTCGAICTRLTRIRDQRCLQTESLPILVNWEPRRPSCLHPAAIPPRSSQNKRSSLTLHFAATGTRPPVLKGSVLMVLRAGSAMGGACPIHSGQTCYSTYVVGDGHKFAQAYCT